MITPLCGNGMSMALHASKIAAEQSLLFLQGKISRATLEEDYTSKWRKAFSARLKTGRLIQRLFVSNRLINLLIGLGKIFPGITRSIIRQTHGKPF
jgi:flavin-dependent dehydrogenase